MIGARTLAVAPVAASTLSVVGAITASDWTAWSAALVAVASSLLAIVTSIASAIRETRRAAHDLELAERWKEFALREREKAIEAGSADPFPSGLPPLNQPMDRR